jgi:hypothetical protein
MKRFNHATLGQFAQGGKTFNDSNTGSFHHECTRC